MKKINLQRFKTYIMELLARFKFSGKPYLLKIKLGHKQKFADICWKSPKIIAGAVTFGIVVVGSSVYLCGSSSADYLILNGRPIGIVTSEKAGQQMIEDILKSRGQAIGEPAKTHEQITYEPVRVRKASLIQEAVTKKELQNTLKTYFDGVSLEIAGVQVAILPSQADVQKALKEYQDFYVKPSDNNQVSSVEFAETVSTKSVEAQVDQIKLPEQVFKELKDGKVTTTDYTVQANDSWWLIARKNNMKTKEVLAGNPGMTENSTIQSGQKIKLVTATPYLNVISKGTRTDTEIVAFDVITHTNSQLPSGKTIIKQQGSDGSKLVTYSYTQKNGVDVAKQVVEEKEIKTPVEQIVDKGPSRLPLNVAYAVSRGSGVISGIAWPLRGSINSYYGSRSGSFHTGIDIGGDTGEPYTAAASGTVVAAGWSGGYGNMILIDHGNGVMTRYGHSSRLLVSVGQQVSRGQTIGLVGATGNATGPHLHFEIIQNGDTVNPLNYLP
ncbi:peptidoglycan DD-metalloendopeptidase family protein [Desulfosporosinus sp. PR]|uniref:peptidoglycan DD-metalloendopeptidase family protein n=1 Tax=Candidatus Desulfosporosinus nitrosoreducens TaxID=3401928 RepID=UPI0027FF9E42|nr:peptidoglycan DD-metalloendopeptidase family protein [Desulfosporosinus sp. PR]MDQ7092710.1 peptidoglycan DD-metalloendopeptidase family protein [Desulfosporosinus sp. PR]